MADIDIPIGEVTSIPRNYISKIKKLGIKTLRDLLYYFPVKYQKFDKLTPLNKIKAGEAYCVKGKVIKVDGGRSMYKKVHITKITIQEGTSEVSAVWFGQHYLSKIIFPGETIMLAGKISNGKMGLFFSNPLFEKVENKLIADLKHVGRIIPIYSLTAGVSSKWLRFIMKPLVEKYADDIPETFPKKILTEHKLMPVKKAIWQVHFPDTEKMGEVAKHRFAFEEMFLLQISVLREKLKLQEYEAAAMPIKLERLKHFISMLPYTLTDDQKRSVWKIVKDTETSTPMNRLLQGDVGSGKTVVAALAALNVIKNGHQVAFMAPTEILAIQHFKTLGSVFKGFDANIGFLTGSSDKFISKKLKGQPIKVSRKKLIDMTAKGKLDIIVGTHALIKGKLKFQDLAFVVVDEQHRFGVKQRGYLTKNKTKIVPHFLSMTATPIPRSLALTIYGDLDISTIKQLPKGRKKIKTETIEDEERPRVYKFIAKEIKKGRQVYVICPRINEGEKKDSIWSEVKTVEQEYQKLREIIFPQFTVAMLHGKMKPKEKEKIMDDFKAHKSDILVSTSVVEVGVDVPNATVMMIEGADRFGLAQLHQFRGRVGRDKHQSYCFLLTSTNSAKTNKRAKVMTKYDSGFQISQADLNLRGPGQFVGIKQSGIPDKTMQMLQNMDTVEKARNAARELLEKDPQLKKHKELAKLSAYCRENLHLE